MKPGILEHWTDWLLPIGLAISAYYIFAVFGAWTVWMFHLVMSIGKQ